jgi:oxygen-independent coproporphyrinogen-3 oxidase
MALEENPNHISVYGLTVESHTPLGRWVAARTTSEAPEEEFERQYMEADALLNSAGFEHYEVSNYGRPGWQSRHNWAYWTRRPYLGIGPSAHGFDGRERRWNVSAYAEWLKRLDAGVDPVGGREQLDRDQEEHEELYLGLRTNSGVTVPDLDRETVRCWVDSQWAVLTGSRLRLTSAGWLRLDALANALTPVRSR